MTLEAIMQLATIFPGVRGEIRQDEPMAQHTSWRVGGAAGYYFKPQDREDLSLFLSVLPRATPLLWVGHGSNLLIRDGGFPGAVVCCHGQLSDLEKVAGHRLYAEAGVSCAKVARFSTRAGLQGAEFLAGIPGTIGGALAMNAGAFGGEIWDIVSSVELIDRDGQVHGRSAAHFEPGYRAVDLPVGHWFLSATLGLATGNAEYGRGRIRSLLVERADRQPVRGASAGSVFRNPIGDYAARLIDKAGLKGLRRGDAEVSLQHANFIVNCGHASASDIEALISQVQSRVKEQFGVLLEPEVRIVGERS